MSNFKPSIILRMLLILACCPLVSQADTYNVSDKFYVGFGAGMISPNNVDINTAAGTYNGVTLTNGFKAEIEFDNGYQITGLLGYRLNEYLSFETELGYSKFDYEKIECIMQGSRDYIKFMKRGFGRTTHLASIDIRNKRIKKEDGEELVKLYDGKRPRSIDLLMKILKLSEKELYEIVTKHTVYPHNKMSFQEFQSKKSNFSPKEIEEWFNKFK